MSTFWLVLLLTMVVVNCTHGQRKKPPRIYQDEYPEARREKKLDSVVTIVSQEHPDCAKCLDKKYLQHYEAMNCKLQQGEVICNNPCPKYYECPVIRTSHNRSVCYFRERIYKIGDSVPMDNPCRECICVNRNHDSSGRIEADIECTSIECPEGFGINPPEVQPEAQPQDPLFIGDQPQGSSHIEDQRSPSKFNRTLPPQINKKHCYNIYEHDKCCSARRYCPTDQEMRKLKTCVYKDKKYKPGERIFPTEDPCVQCICGEGWNPSQPLKSKACTRVQCDIDFELSKRPGCIPIYHEGTCCPIDYHCPTPKNRKCYFDDNYYPIGAKLKIDNNCVECECKVPPDFTCIQKQCPTPDDPACTVHYEEGQCCGKIECPSKTPELNSSVIVPPSNCPPWIPGGLACQGYNCMTTQDEFGCQVCKCERECPEITCGEGCHIYVVSPGECPRCTC